VPVIVPKVSTHGAACEFSSLLDAATDAALEFLNNHAPSIRPRKGSPPLASMQKEE
jgi:hypothetical protein